MLARPPVLVIVSHYAARPSETLIELLDGLACLPAGIPYHLRVVVNRDGDEQLRLPAVFGELDVCYRPNAGYNLGAWEAGWRLGPPYAGYLFLQDECRVVQSDWAGAFVRAASMPGVGLVGECRNPDWDASWDVLAGRFWGQTLPGHAVAGRLAERIDCYLDFFRRQRIDPGLRGDHLQSLVLFATRDVLERVDGFPQGADYGEAIAAEIGTTKRVQACGLAAVEVGPQPFFYVEHPQWRHRRPGRGSGAGRMAE